MPVKDFFRKMRPMQLYVVLTLTIVLFLTELVVSHITHATTLLMDSYNMLCNILALIGCLITIKYGNKVKSTGHESPKGTSIENIEEISLKTNGQDKKIKKSSESKQEKKLKNTFGWARIDVITMLTCCVFLFSFCFSVYIEASQTLAHIDHHHEMHYPIAVLCIGVGSLLLNGLCYLLIGGFTFHQGSFLHVTESGDVVLKKVVVNDSVRKGARRLSSSTTPTKRQGLREMTRDVIGCTWVIIASVIVIFTEPEVAKFIDPILALVSATSIVILSYPYMKESCMILLQTMPDTTNIDVMKKELVSHFPDIINIHDFHIWQLTASKVISTIHIIFENPKVYHSMAEQIKEFFLENGVTQVTIQPEFFRQSTSLESLTSGGKPPPVCLVACQGELCKLNHCCQTYQELSKFKSSSKDILPGPDPGTPALTSLRIIDGELRSLKSSASSASTYSLNSIEGTEHSKSSGELVKHSIKEEEADEESNDATKEGINNEAENPIKHHEENIMVKEEGASQNKNLKSPSANNYDQN